MSVLSAILSPTIDLLRYLETSIDCEWISAEFNIDGVEFTVSRDDELADKDDANKENKPAKSKKSKRSKRCKKTRRTRRTEPSLRISLLKRLLKKRIDEMLGHHRAPIEALRTIAEQEQQQRSRSLLSFDFFDRI